MALFLSLPNVAGSQESTYSPIEEQVDTATSTQLETPVSVTPEVVTPPKPQPVVVPTTLSQEEVVSEILNVFPDAPIMVAVAKCESNLNPSADRKGIDGGLFQVNQVHLPRLNALGLNRYDLNDNLTYARMLYDESGLGPWYMSKHCWSKYM